jgi:hypothetical protein
MLAQIAEIDYKIMSIPTNSDSEFGRGEKKKRALRLP